MQQDMKQRVLPLRVDDELYAWLKDYAERKHSKMAGIITRLLVDQKEKDELDQSARHVSQLRKKPTPPRRKK